MLSLSKRQWGLIGLTVLALAGLLVWIKQGADAPLSLAKIETPSPPEHLIENAVLTRFDDEGAVQHRIEARRLTYRPSTDTTRLKAPQATLFDRHARQWDTRAQRAEINRVTGTVTFIENARIQAPDEGWQLASQRLVYQEDTAHISSDRLVTLTAAPQQITAQAMDLWLDDERLRLADQVTGTHPPAPTHPAPTHIEDSR